METIGIHNLTDLERKCLTKIINLLFDQNYISANFGVITDAFYVVEYRDSLGDIIPKPANKLMYGITETRTTNFPMPLLKRTVNALVEKRFLQKIYRDDDDAYELSDEFVEDAYRIHLNGSSMLGDDIPAADRFVSTKDNQKEVSQAVESIEALSEAIRSSNELFATAEERIQVSKEISALKEIIEQPFIHATALWDAAKNNSTLKWLAEQTASAIVRQAASTALQHLENLLHLLISKL